MRKLLILLFFIFNISLSAATTVSWGSAQDLGQGALDYLSIDKLDTNKMIFFYGDYAGGGSPGEARVGTVSGSTITFGGVQTLNSNISAGYNADVVALSATLFVAAYQGDISGDDGRVRAGSVSGTDITLGDEVQYDPGDTEYPSICKVRANTFLIVYNDETNSDQGTVIVGTTSGTTITMYTPVVFEGYIMYCESCYIEDDKVVIFYHDYDDNAKVKTAVVTISGTTPTVNTIYEVNSTTGAAYSGSVKLLDTNKVVYGYHFDADLCARIGTISGTSISLGDEAEIEAASIPTALTISAQPIDASTFIICWSPGGDNYVYSNICTVSGTTITAAGADDTIIAEDANWGDMTLVDTDKLIFLQGRAGEDAYAGTLTLPSGWTGVAWGVTNPATVFGKAVADIDKVWGQ